MEKNKLYTNYFKPFFLISLCLWLTLLCFQMRQNILKYLRAKLINHLLTMSSLSSIPENCKLLLIKTEIIFFTNKTKFPPLISINNCFEVETLLPFMSGNTAFYRVVKNLFCMSSYEATI